MSEDTSLIPYEATYTAVEMVRPLVDPLAAKAAIQQYERLKQAIQQPGDIQVYQGRPFLKKAFWRRIATCFGLSLDLVREQRGFDEGNRLYYSVLYRATAPNGRGVTADGYCSTAEKGHESWPEHTVRATAHTRAKNRAISDLVGGGEVSAEEMPDDDDAPRPAQTRPAPAPAQPARKPAPPTATASAKPALAHRAPTDTITAAEWDALKRRMFNEAKIETPAQFQAFTQAHLKRDLAGELPTLAEFDKLIAATNRAAAQLRTVARTARPADSAPTPSADEMAAGQADYDASRDASQAADQDFPPADNDIDLSKLPMGAMPS